MYENVKGTRDYPPEIMIIRNKIRNLLSEIFEKYGYEPIETPIVEYWDTLKEKYGEEAENKLIWRFKLPYSDKEYALKYDQTIPLARFYSKYQYKLPFKRYVIDRSFRYEESQKSRYREFYQADYDIIGSSSFLSDYEILEITDFAFKKIGFEKYKIKINDRRIVDIIFDKIGIKEKKEVLRIIDKLDKIGIDGVKNELKKVLNEEKTNKIIELLENNGKNGLEYIRENYKEAENYLINIEYFMKKIKSVDFDVSIVRGLDYYTGMIFELKFEDSPLSYSAGGRYDNLLKIFVKRDIPAVGGSIGFDRVIDYGIEKGIFKIERKSVIDVCIVYFKETLEMALEIRKKLIDLGINTYIDLMGRNFNEQIEYAVDKDIRYLLIVGKKEIENNYVLLQDRATREKIYIKLNEIEKIRNIINKWPG